MALVATALTHNDVKLQNSLGHKSEKSAYEPWFNFKMSNIACPEILSILTNIYYLLLLMFYIFFDNTDDVRS